MKESEIYLLVILVTLLCWFVVVPIFKRMFLWFMRVVFKVEPYKYLKGWKRINQN